MSGPHMIDLPRSVSIVSGDASVRSNLRNVLSEQGDLHVFEFETGAAYMAAGRSEVPACLILDVSLPDMCGLELQRKLAGAGPPLLFVTRRADVALSVRAIKAGAFDYLTVPFEASALLQAACAAIDFDRNTRA